MLVWKILWNFLKYFPKIFYIINLFRNLKNEFFKEFSYFFYFVDLDSGFLIIPSTRLSIHA